MPRQKKSKTLKSDVFNIRGVELNDAASDLPEVLGITHKTWDSVIKELNEIYRSPECKRVSTLLVLALNNKKINGLLNADTPQGLYVLAFLCGIVHQKISMTGAFASLVTEIIKKDAEPKKRKFFGVF